MGARRCRSSSPSLSGNGVSEYSKLSGTGRQVGLSFNLSSDVLTTIGAFANEMGKFDTSGEHHKNSEREK